MKKTDIGPAAAVILVVVFGALLGGCASTSAPKQVKAEGTPLDQLSPYHYYDPLTDLNCTFIFAGETWSQEIDGVPTFSGVFEYGETESVLEITKAYDARSRRWVGERNQAPIILEYEANPLTLTIRR